MSFGIQCCVSCGKLEEGPTGPADRFICRYCYQSEAAEAAYYAAYDRGEICSFCDGPKKKEETQCDFCAKTPPKEKR